MTSPRQENTCLAIAGAGTSKVIIGHQLARILSWRQGRGLTPVCPREWRLRVALEIASVSSRGTRAEEIVSKGRSLALVAVLSAAAVTFGLRARGLARRDAEAYEVSERLRETTGRHSWFLERIREAAMARATIESKLEGVDSVLDAMNADIASAHVRREQIDYHMFELNQKQHELLTNDLAAQRKRLDELTVASAGAGEAERALARKLETTRETSWIRYAFW